MLGLAPGDLKGVSCLSLEGCERTSCVLKAGRLVAEDLRSIGASGEGLLFPLLGVFEVELSSAYGLSRSPSWIARLLAGGPPSPGEPGSRSA
jgi:hypothetical protein